MDFVKDDNILVFGWDILLVCGWMVLGRGVVDVVLFGFVVNFEDCVKRE